MNVDPWKRIEELYHASLELPPADRPRFLTEACAGNEALRSEVESLLSYDERAGNFIETPAFELAARQWASDASSKRTAEAASLSPIPEQIGIYQLMAPLAKGGMGEVYLAIDTRLKRKVAIKLMPVECADDPKRGRRFEQEACAASALNHPNILTVHEIGQMNGRNYIVTEYVEGQTLRERLIDGQNSRIGSHEAVRIASQIANALQSAHAAGIIHRDIKPENVMLRPDGLVKVLDFGLAKISPAHAEGELLARLSTQKGIVMGTAAYMSPEQARGQALDHRTDIFSLGVLLYEMLGRRRPFEGPTTSDVIAAILTRDPVPLSKMCPDISPSLQAIVSRCLEKDRQKRFQSAGELRSALEAPLPVLQPQPTPERIGSTRGGSRPLIAGLALVLFVLALVLLSSYNDTGDSGEVADATHRGKTEIESKQRDYGPGANFAFTVPDGWILSWSDAPAVSPDGKYIVFSALPTSAEVGREVSLWVRDLDSSEARLLSGTEGAASPFWSPDSRFVAFWAKGMLRKIEISGGAAATVCSVARGFAGTWSQDGVILFPSLVALGSRLCRVAATGGQAVMLDSFAEGETARYDPRFLPDGRHFFYYSENRDSQLNGLYVASLDSGRNRRLVLRNTGSALYVSPGYLLYSRGNRLMAQRFDLQRLVVAGEPSIVAQGVASYGGGTSPPISAFHSIIFTSNRASTRNIYRVPADGGETQKLVESPSDKHVEDISPDGRFLIFNSRLATSNTRGEITGHDLYVIPLDQPGRLIQFLATRFREDQAQFSPDSRWVAYCSNETDGPQVVVRGIAADGTASGDKWQVSRNGGTQPRWRGDGKELFYLERNTLMSVPVEIEGPVFSAGSASPLFSADIEKEERRNRYLVTKDGRRFLVIARTRVAPDSTIGVQLDWLAALKQ